MTASASTNPSGLIDGRMSLGAAELDDLFPTGEADRRSTVTYWVLLVLASFVPSAEVVGNYPTFFKPQHVVPVLKPVRSASQAAHG